MIFQLTFYLWISVRFHDIHSLPLNVLPCLLIPALLLGPAIFSILHTTGKQPQEGAGGLLFRKQLTAWFQPLKTYMEIIFIQSKQSEWKKKNS